MSVHDLVALPRLASLSVSTRTEDLATLAEFGRAMTSSVPVEERLSRALSILARRLGAVRSVVHAADTAQRALYACASHGLAISAWQVQYGQGVVGGVAENTLPMVVAEVNNEPLARFELKQIADWLPQRWSLVCVPIAMEGRAVGTLSVYLRAEPDGELSGLLDILDIVASLLGPTVLQWKAAQVRPHLREVNSDDKVGLYNMIGDSSSMRAVYQQISQVARTNATVLIRGPSGTGKELVAHAIHAASARSSQAFVKVNCAALPDTLFESEVFGHERGAFTGALTRKKGRFELAEGGTLFLDEIGELSPPTQAKLLRALQFGEFERLGSTETLQSDIRVIAATNRDLELAVSNGTFREDLYYRFNVFSISLPRLAERLSDVPALAEHFASRFSQEHHGAPARISREALDVLCDHSFPGNVRELQNIIERAVVVSEGATIRPEHLPESLRSAKRGVDAAALTLAGAVGRLEMQLIEQALLKAHGSPARAARTLGTTERIVRYKAAKYGLNCGRSRV
ncbi:MAG TPA: sigma 54-interacting transcriptional regulator [Polyangiaceae bacterium]|jgi:Nif-specific regulatory protein|nr:sigma 54-interacting transcriptional regulator [Polyangiaceae bacterium]